MASNTIKVVARFRPPNKVELANGGETVVGFDSDDTCNVQSGGDFTFDRVFGTQSQQIDIFDYSIRPTVDDILNGYNGTVFAYGQTGAGKSYTMMGGDIDDDASKGVIPRIVEQVFASIMASPQNIEYTVRVSYMEIYMEKIRDLLNPANDNLPVHEEKNRGVYVKGLLEIYVSSVGEVYEVMRRGGLARATAATNMNQESSRSHSIFVITVAQKNIETGSAKSGTLYLVDLAGSEKVGKTGASGQTLEEAKKINKSLSALGMVINALTDGKSSHVPYRDSKLTRILQESLGGNSRTTLIINCSPNSYNQEETISTLRFGVRAKKIQNKAKINAELSPAELKALLKKAQHQVTTFEDYISNLEGEVAIWRQGQSVPESDWTPARSEAPSVKKTDQRPPGTPSRLQSSDFPKRADTPSRPDSRLDLDRASTPSIVLEKDEREEFLRRENELQDQLAERESQVSRTEDELKRIKEELHSLRSNSKGTSTENERLQSEVNDFKMQLERVQFESKETLITMDGLKEANGELTAELDEVKRQLLDAKINMSETNALLEEKERKKAERMAQMMASFDLGGEALTENEQTIRKVIERIDLLHQASSAGSAVAPEDIQEIRQRLLEAQGIVRQADATLTQRVEHDEMSMKRREDLESHIANLEHDYEELLEKNLGEADIEDVKKRLGDAYVKRRSVDNDLTNGLKEDLTRSRDDNQRLRVEYESLQQRLRSQPSEVNGATLMNGGAGSKSIQQQIADFDIMKKSLMRDLQNRCERVVELEISLDETREQYNNVLRTSNNRAQQKKMAFLERNLEQLTHVQRQLVEQNSSLKKEVAIAERKLLARNERIQSLELLLQDSQEKLTASNHRFEQQLTAVKERLEAAKVGTRGLGSPVQAGSGTFNLGSRVAKPLRGGGEVNGNQQQPQAQGSKRASWFFNQRFSSGSGGWT